MKDITNIIEKFKDFIDTDEGKKWKKKCEETKELCLSLMSKDHIKSLTKENFRKVMKALFAIDPWTYFGRILFSFRRFSDTDEILKSSGPKIDNDINHILKENGGVERIRDALSDLFYGSEPLHQRYDNFRNRIKYLDNPSTLTELMAFTEPQKFGIWNEESNAVFEAVFKGALSFPQTDKALPDRVIEPDRVVEYQISGKDYESCINVLTRIKEELGGIITNPDFIDVDFFLSFISYEILPALKNEFLASLKSRLLSAIEDIKEQKYKSGVQKLIEIEKNLQKYMDDDFLPDCSFHLQEYLSDTDESLILQIIFGEFSKTWDDYYKLLKEMDNTGFLEMISRYYSIWIDPNSVLSPWLETLIINEKMDCVEILCNNLSNALIDAPTVLKMVGLGKKYMEQLNAKTKEFDEKIKELKENNQIDIEKAKMITENSIKKYCPPNINSDIIIKSIPAYKRTYKYLISGEAFIDFCTKKSEEIKDVDFSGPCLYYFKAVETFMCDRIKEIIKSNIPVHQKYFGNQLKTITSGSSDWNNLSLYDYERIIVEILKPGAPFSKIIADSITTWRREVRNSKVHKTPVPDLATVLKVKEESYKLLSTLFSVLVKENIQGKYVKMNI